MSLHKEEVDGLIKTSIEANNSKHSKDCWMTVSKLNRSNDESAESQMREFKLLKFYEPHKFKRKANQDQFWFNQKLSETLDSARSAAEKAQLEKIKRSKVRN